MKELNWLLENYEYLVAVGIAVVAAGTALYKTKGIKDKMDLIAGYIPLIKTHYPKIKVLVSQVVAWAKRKK